MDSDGAAKACHSLAHTRALDTYKLLPPEVVLHLESGSSTSTREEGTILPAPVPWSRASTAKLALRPGHEPKQIGALVSRPCLRSRSDTSTATSQRSQPTATDIDLDILYHQTINTTSCPLHTSSR